MATSSKKTTTTSAASTTSSKKSVAKKVVATTPAKKVSAPKTEKFAGKPAAIAESVPKKSIKRSTVTPEDRYRMIATAAYFRAEQRGFACGYKMVDWLASEAQIDAKLSA
ncbi:MAG: DUF2934 domain-containing protein [Gallionellaceae bacterium]|nr:DUF2934 domain-containing protein [Gallionellaceae bacterium]